VFPRSIIFSDLAQINSSRDVTMEKILKFLALASCFQLFTIVEGHSSAIKVSGSPPANASAPIPEAFVSYSIEFSSFPDFAGMPFSLMFDKC
jgi:hypothetical protein